MKLDVFGEQAVRADKDVHLARRYFFDNGLLFLPSSKARNHFDVDGKLRKSFLECLEMLKAQNRCRREHCNLFAVLHSLEGRAHGHFCFAITHIAAEKPIHRRGRFHVVLDGAYR